jgi:hypothetical protein
MGTSEYMPMLGKDKGGEREVSLADDGGHQDAALRGRRRVAVVGGRFG